MGMQGQCVGADVLIVDPPRKGLEPEVLQSLCDRKQSLTNSVKRLIYVSCGFEALKRDADVSPITFVSVAITCLQRAK